VLGGAATAGFAYFFALSWVLDGSYAYAWTKAQTSNYLGSYSNASGKLIQAGTLIGQSTARSIRKLLRRRSTGFSPPACIEPCAWAQVPQHRGSEY
jgi:hypothetical protein